MSESIAVIPLSLFEQVPLFVKPRHGRKLHANRRCHAIRTPSRLTMPSGEIFLTGYRTIINSSIAASQYDELAARKGLPPRFSHGSLRRSPGLRIFIPFRVDSRLSRARFEQEFHAGACITALANANK
jgi:hypothetical protein